MVLEKTLRVPCTAKWSNQSILKPISPKYSLEGLMLKLKLQYFGHLMWRTDSSEKTLMLGKTEGKRRKGRTEDEMASPTQWTWVWVNSGSLWWTGKPGVLQSMGSQRVGHDWATELNWRWGMMKTIFMKVKLLLAQLYPTLWNSMGCSPPGSSVHGILQARILGWVAIPFSRGSSQPRDQTWVSCIAGRFFTIWVTSLNPLYKRTAYKQIYLHGEMKHFICEFPQDKANSREGQVSKETEALRGGRTVQRGRSTVRGGLCSRV